MCQERLFVFFSSFLLIFCCLCGKLIYAIKKLIQKEKNMKTFIKRLASFFTAVIILLAHVLPAYADQNPEYAADLIDQLVSRCIMRLLQKGVCL